METIVNLMLMTCQLFLATSSFYTVLANIPANNVILAMTWNFSMKSRKHTILKPKITGSVLVTPSKCENTLEGVENNTEVSGKAH